MVRLTLKICYASLATAIAIAMSHLPAIAAERVVLNYKAHQRSIAVEDLAELVETGEVSRPLQVHLDRAGQDPENLRQVLDRELEASVVLLDGLLNNPLGYFALEQISQAVYTPSQEAETQALRAAIVLAASDDSKLTLLEVLQNYPTQEVHVDGDRIEDAYEDFMNAVERIRPVLDGLETLQQFFPG